MESAQAHHFLFIVLEHLQILYPQGSWNQFPVNIRGWLCVNNLAKLRSDFAQYPKTRLGMSEHRWEAGCRIPFTASKGLTSDGAGDAAELQCNWEQKTRRGPFAG